MKENTVWQANLPWYPGEKWRADILHAVKDTDWTQLSGCELGVPLP